MKKNEPTRNTCRFTNPTCKENLQVGFFIRKTKTISH